MELKISSGSGWVAGYHNALVRRAIENENERRGEIASMVTQYRVGRFPIGDEVFGVPLARFETYEAAQGYIDHVTSSGQQISPMFITNCLVPKWSEGRLETPVKE